MKYNTINKDSSKDPPAKEQSEKDGGNVLGQNVPIE